MEELYIILLFTKIAVKTLLLYFKKCPSHDIWSWSRKHTIINLGSCFDRIFKKQRIRGVTHKKGEKAALTPIFYEKILYFKRKKQKLDTVSEFHLKETFIMFCQNPSTKYFFNLHRCKNESTPISVGLNTIFHVSVENERKLKTFRKLRSNHYEFVTSIQFHTIH